ncbi:MAG: urease accessory protein UreE [Candidatus Thiosymbion ectosymbiont of Robbea hypermnestra]|nr:urease accessory protein UreE [Candidatus Thiosymbion ectosymbiont of Robbea hypermnestra]
MIRLIRGVEGPATPDGAVTMTLEQRLRRRLWVTLDDGREAGLFLARNEGLQDGDLLVSEEGLVVRVRAAPERVSTVLSHDPQRLARACYHLGNRHVALQIEPGRLRYLQDSVLDEMVRGLGLRVRVEDAPFEPEPGAYGRRDHGHGRHRH